MNIKKFIDDFLSVPDYTWSVDELKREMIEAGFGSEDIREGIEYLGTLIKEEEEKSKSEPEPKADPDTTPDWNGECENCGASPIVPITGMCGPCTFGEAGTAGGNW